MLSETALYSYYAYCGACSRLFGLNMSDCKKFCPHCGTPVADHNWRDEVFAYFRDPAKPLAAFMPETLPGELPLLPPEGAR